jgi:S-adenosylmethionine decarboxylase
MAGMDAGPSFAELRQHEAALPKVLYAIDARFGPDSPVTDVAVLRGLATAAVDAGGGHVLDGTHVIFPNGALTLVLILAESHLSIHTWPEENLIAIDLFSCGAIDGQAVLDRLAEALRLTEVTVRELQRGLPPG